MKRGVHAEQNAPPQQGMPAAAGKAPSTLRSLVLTFGTQVLVAVGTLVLYRLLATRTGIDGFATYSLIKQAVTLLFPVVTVGLVGGLPRYIALARQPGSPSADAFLTAGTVVSGAAVAVSAGLALAMPGPTARLFFGDAGATGSVPAFVALLAATAVFYLAYGYFRGQMQMSKGNLMHIVGMGALPPLLVLALPNSGIDTLVLLMAAGLGGLSLAVMVVPLLRGAAGRARATVPTAGRSLLGYGARRVPGEIAQVALFALVPLLAAHVAGLREVAYLAAGLQVAIILTVALNPLGVVLLPTLARSYADDRSRATQQVAWLAALGLHVGLFAAFQVLIFADVAVQAWLGEDFAEADAIVRVIGLAVPLFAFYLTMRSSLDAAAVRSYNSRSNISALAVFAGVAALLLSLELIRPALAVAWAFTAGVTVQGLMTFFYVHRLFGLAWSDYSFAVAAPLALLTGALAWAARPVIEGSPLVLLFLAGLELVLAALYFGCLAGSNVGWTRVLRERLGGLRRP